MTRLSGPSVLAPLKHGIIVVQILLPDLHALRPLAAAPKAKHDTVGQANGNSRFLGVNQVSKRGFATHGNSYWDLSHHQNNIYFTAVNQSSIDLLGKSLYLLYEGKSSTGESNDHRQTELQRNRSHGTGRSAVCSRCAGYVLHGPDGFRLAAPGGRDNGYRHLFPTT